MLFYRKDNVFVNLILFTESYPYILGGEQNFLEVEAGYLSSTFERVLIVPQRLAGDLLKKLPPVDVDISYARLISSYGPIRTLLLGIFSWLFLQDILDRPSLLLFPVALKRLAFCAGRAKLTYRWLKKWLNAQGSDGSDCLLYTYWFDQAAVGGALVKQEFPGVKLVSRAHGYDIYDDEYYRPVYWPCRRFVFSQLNHLFPASKNGADYLKNRYRPFISNCDHAHLGVVDPGFISHPSDDGVFRIVSCSMLEWVKRIDLIMDSVCTAARLRKDQKFEWIHIGNGKNKTEFQKRLEKTFPPNARGYFREYVDRADLMNFYKSTPVDVFINLSSTEGGAPVSIMEAASCGIPVIATNVGGNPEIALEQNGILVGANPSPEEVANAMFLLMDDPELAKSKRLGSRKTWETRFNADVNFLNFARRLRQIRSDS